MLYLNPSCATRESLIQLIVRPHGVESASVLGMGTARRCRNEEVVWIAKG